MPERIIKTLLDECVPLVYGSGTERIRVRTEWTTCREDDESRHLRWVYGARILQPGSADDPQLQRRHERLVLSQQVLMGLRSVQDVCLQAES